MKRSRVLVLLLFILVNSCTTEISDTDVAKWKQEILETEQKFARLVSAKGVREAFLTYAAKEAVLMRNNELVEGKEEIEQYLSDKISKNLSWKPEFVDVSKSGDIGYTYGYYTFSYTDSTGTKQEQTGVFHTVWKKQEDGSWKFVWD